MLIYIYLYIYIYIYISSLPIIYFYFLGVCKKWLQKQCVENICSYLYCWMKWHLSRKSNALNITPPGHDSWLYTSFLIVGIYPAKFVTEATSLNVIIFWYLYNCGFFCFTWRPTVPPTHAQVVCMIHRKWLLAKWFALLHARNTHTHTPV